MAPTLVDLDGFAHLLTNQAQAGSGFVGTWDTFSDAGAVLSFDRVNKRTPLHDAAVKIAADASNTCNFGWTIAASTRVFVGSFYFRFLGVPAANAIIAAWTGPTGATNLKVLTSGLFQIVVGSGTAVANFGSICDGKWHRVDYKLNTSANPLTLDCQVDGIAITQATSAQAAVDIATFKLGPTANAGISQSMWLSDHVYSVTAGDYPIGSHSILPVYLSADGTHTLGSTNAIQTDTGGSSNLIAVVNDWNGTGGTPDTTHYLTYASTTTGDAASNFAEFTLPTIPSRYVVWDVKAYLAGFAAGTTTDNADCQVLASHGGTLIDHVGNLIDYSGSTSVLGIYRRLLTRPGGGWTPSNLGASVVQWGRSTDTNPQPRFSAFMMEMCIQHPPHEDSGNFPLATP